ncbi:O-antigen ligase family protein [Muricoccus aerilatus]|uniref:O-antigen ligase family protein n=1 Tax=Muricoccus aerilatus TaxID=452982 RepID=UPI0005C25A7B|nr:O-antigen ligase family protein [Roseomonas aerilata]
MASRDETGAIGPFPQRPVLSAHPRLRLGGRDEVPPVVPPLPPGILPENRISEYDDAPGFGALNRGPPRAWWWNASLPLAVAAAIAPTVTVLQFRAIAPLATIAMLLAVLAHRRERGRWPWPRALAVPVLVLLAAFGAVSVLWSPEPRWALAAAGSLAGLALLGGASAVVVEDETLSGRRALGWCILGGLAVGLLLGAFDNATGQSVRAAVRGLAETRPGLEFGLKPAASFMALLLPLVLKARLPEALRWVLLALGAVLVFLMPGETAKIAGLAGLAVAALVRVGGRGVSNLVALVLAGSLLATPVLLPLTLRPDIAAEMPRSALHRMLIWDFGLERAAEHPLLGWGMEASRNLPGGRDNPSDASIARLGVSPTGANSWLREPGIERMSLHPHNGGLQLWLELGAVGLVLGSLATLALGWGATPMAAGVLASAAVSFLASFGVWQGWWLASLAFAGALAAGLSVRRGQER